MKTNKIDSYIERVFNYLHQQGIGDIPEILDYKNSEDIQMSDCNKVVSILNEKNIISLNEIMLNGVEYYELTKFAQRFADGKELLKYLKSEMKEESRKKRRETVTFRLVVWSFVVSVIAITISVLAVVFG